MESATTWRRTPIKDLSRRLVAEGLGTALLLAAVVGSGIMAQRLATGPRWCCSATRSRPARLAVAILTFGPVSGAHFNPAVTVRMAARANYPGASRGSTSSPRSRRHHRRVAANAMFDLPPCDVHDGPRPVRAAA